MPTPPPIPPPSPQAPAMPPVAVLPYSGPQPESYWPRTPPELAFIGRISIWLGVIYLVIALPLILVFGLMSVSRELDTPFWLALLALSVVQMVASIVLIVGAMPARRRKVLPSAIGSGVTAMTSIGFVIALAVDMSHTTRFDYAPLAGVALLFAGISGWALRCCIKQHAAR